MTVDIITILIAGALIVAGSVAILTTNEARRLRVTTTPPTQLYDGAAADAPALVAPSLMLEGHPDAVTREADGAIVVTLTCAGTAPPVAAPPALIRLAGEMLAAEEALGVTVTRGLLRYQDRALVIPLSPALRTLAQQCLMELRACEGAGPHMTRQEPATCRACAYRAMCAIGRINAPAPHSVMG